ncbi:MAG: peptidylprolyl isomerase [Planctomycetota bacterium]|jgi:peptidyl-prolyl cis-trans isomerase C
MMKNRLYARFEILACFLISWVTFGSTANCGPNTVPVEPNIPAKEAAGIAVTVNGIAITESQLDAEVTRELGRMRIPPQMPPQFLEQYKKQLRRQALDRLIGNVLVDEKIKAEVVVTEEEVLGYLEGMAAAQRPPLTLEDIKRRIATLGQDFEQIKANIRRALGYQRLMMAQWAGRINVTEVDAKKYYDENPRRFESPEQVRASHILIKPDMSDPNVDPNEAKAKAKAKAEELLKKIRDGKDFATLARANSACLSATRGGDLGLRPRGAWVMPFEEAEFKLKVGQVSNIVETQYGYHIIRVTDRKEPSRMMFEQAKDGIISELTRKRREEIAKEYIDSLKAKAKFVYPPGKEPKVSRPLLDVPKPAPADRNAPAKPKGANAVE